MDSIFRKKSLDKISSPDQMNDYIRVTTPSVWIALLALVVLLVGILVWSILGTVELHDEDGKPEEIHPIHGVLPITLMR